jgi:glycosyltransferase involved in cell wall biosynthesis
MRILIVSPVLPYPQTSGFTIRVFQFLDLLARHHEVSLLAYGGPDEEDKVAALRKICAEVAVVRPQAAATSGKRFAQFASMVSWRSYQTSSHYSLEMQRRLDEMAARRAFDVIQVETSPLAGFRFARDAAVVLVEHDIIFELLYRMYQAERSPVRRLYNRLEYAKFRRDEIATWRRVDGCILTSSREVPIVRRHAPAVPVHVAPNGVDGAYFTPSSAAVDENAIVMTGFMKTRPNIDGALFFVNDILPRVLRSKPAVKFYIVGGSPPEEIRRLVGPHIVVTGEVADVRPYVHKAAALVVPLRMGGGTRLKILEGLSMEKPMVSTTIGAEGIDVKHREHLLIADEPSAFADAVVHLLSNPAAGGALARAGKELVDRTYQWSAVVDRVETFYEGLVQSPRQRAAR